MARVLPAEAAAPSTKEKDMIVLDTDHVTVLEWGTGPDYERLAKRLESIPHAERATTIISYEEQTRGWLAFVARARTMAQQINAYHKLSKHLDDYRKLHVLEFTDDAAAEFQRLTNMRIRIGTQDRKIASIALAHDATLLSRNLRDFERVAGLRVEDWTV